jgi:hypothetical protein
VAPTVEIDSSFLDESDRFCSTNAPTTATSRDYVTREATLLPNKGKAARLYALLGEHEQLTEELHQYTASLFDPALFPSPWPETSSWSPDTLPSTWAEASPIFTRTIEYVLARPEYADVGLPASLLYRTAKSVWRLWRYFPQQACQHSEEPKPASYRCTYPHSTFKLVLSEANDGGKKRLALLVLKDGPAIPLLLDRRTLRKIQTGDLELREVSLFANRLSTKQQQEHVNRHNFLMQQNARQSLGLLEDVLVPELKRISPRGVAPKEYEIRQTPRTFCFVAHLCLRKKRSDNRGEGTDSNRSSTTDKPATFVSYFDPSVLRTFDSPAEAAQALLDDRAIREQRRTRMHNRYSWEYLVAGCNEREMDRHILHTTPAELRTVANKHAWLQRRLSL